MRATERDTIHETSSKLPREVVEEITRQRERIVRRSIVNRWSQFRGGDQTRESCGEEIEDRRERRKRRREKKESGERGIDTCL